MRLTPSADSADGLWRAELAAYSIEENAFTELLVTDRLDDRQSLVLDLSRHAPQLDLRRVFWVEDGEALLLGSYWPESAIYRPAQCLRKNRWPRRG